MKSIPPVANSRFQSPFSDARPRSSWNTGKWRGHNMAAGKPVTGMIKLQIPAGAANPAPPVGPALGQQGVNIMAFCKEFNAATQKQAGTIIPVVITVYKDKSFTFITKQPPSSALIKKALNIASGSKEPNKIKAGKLTRQK